MNTRAADPNRRPGRLAWKNRVSAQAKLVVVLVAGIAMLSAACGRDADDEAGPGSGPATSTTRQLEAVPAPDPVTPEGVAVAALREIYTWKPVSEDQGASLVRARKWLGPSLIRVIEGTTAAGETPKPTLRWAEWAGAGARIDAFTFASGEKAPTGADPNVQQFKIGIEQTVVYPDGREEPLPPATVIATVVRTPDGWRLDGYR
ncbi:hypothetical protein GV791_15400 [Nocardia cyriacigeorgica]|uniref:Uncharacterized protein n=1 Tax=Nocardia cyriacigeorgica TaxID=135487 RepID=A0A6P1CPW4_9NOCA|nr:hypothetical protein [Nocardia cyriacigeorgica]MBF6423579.1 hypothetical protein [Nocardia cyriacigeorgica]NEW33937.1 hypothetical protein [Nocardia cyriacigeorgica]BDT87982.1 hypothetical protein FMUAM8_37460 [Nocardia cyriacigeorgica]